jgi:hypothetical protein
MFVFVQVLDDGPGVGGSDEEIEGLFCPLYGDLENNDSARASTSGPRAIETARRAVAAKLRTRCAVLMIQWAVTVKTSPGNVEAVAFPTSTDACSSRASSSCCCTVGVPSPSLF